MFKRLFALLFSVAVLGVSLPVLSLPTVEKFVEPMTLHSGFYSFYVDNSKGKVYVQVNKAAKPLLFQSSMPYGLGSNDIGLDRGQLGETRIVQFERVGEKSLLKQINTQYRASSANPAERQSIKEAFASSVIWGFKVVAETDETYLIDYTGFLLSDIHGIADRLADTKQGSYRLDTSRSAIFSERIKAFPKNSELEATITFTGSNPGKYVQQVTPAPKSITVHLHHSLIELPDQQYKSRAFHPYAGYWAIEHKDYSAALTDSMDVRVIPRHRLSKKFPSAKMSEPVEPIVYYLDPGIPEEIYNALYTGASWWNNAFEAIGYKNAFQVKTLPADADPMDVRYNVIQWVHRATRGWSYGASVIDPRTGEIIKGHVTLGSLRVRQDLLIALGLTSPFEGSDIWQKPEMFAALSEPAKQMALQRIKQLSAHEVGHTLGIAHNFAASVNDRASVMDYPHPLLSISNGEVDLSNAYTDDIGVWDKHVIAYGYQDFAESSNETVELQRILSAAKQQNLLFMSDPDARPAGSAHPSAHLWDNGADPVEELKRLNAVRKVALQKFGAESVPIGLPLSSIQERVVPIYLLHRFQVQAVAKLIGGVDYSYSLVSESPAHINQVSGSWQNKALTQLLKTLTPEFLMMPESVSSITLPKAYGFARYRETANGRTGITFDPMGLAESSAAHTLKYLLHPERLNRVSQQTARSKKVLGVERLVDDLISKVFTFYKGEEALLNQRVNMLVVEQLMQAALNPQTAPEVQALLHAKLSKLAEQLTKLSKKSNSMTYIGCYQRISAHILRYKSTSEWQSLITPLPMPPGSPI